MTLYSLSSLVILHFMCAAIESLPPCSTIETNQKCDRMEFFVLPLFPLILPLPPSTPQFYGTIESQRKRDTYTKQKQKQTNLLSDRKYINMF